MRTSERERYKESVCTHKKPRKTPYFIQALNIVFVDINETIQVGGNMKKTM